MDTSVECNMDSVHITYTTLTPVCNALACSTSENTVEHGSRRPWA